MLNDQEAPKYLLWLLIAIILMGLDENITGFPFIMGAGIIIYLFINMLILTSKDEPKKENNGQISGDYQRLAYIINDYQGVHFERLSF